MKISIITGASSGMGRDFARAIALDDGIDEIWLIARRADRLEALANELSVPARILPLDLLKSTSFAEFQALLSIEKPEIITLCNISGFGKFAEFTETDLSDCCDMIDLNSKAPVILSHMALPYMKRGSRIINLDSLSSFQPVPYIGVYGATKSFILSFSRALNVELEPRGIRVLAVCPGWVDTEFFSHAVTDNEAVTYYNKIYKSEDVVKRALSDYKKGKDVSILGLQIRLQVLATKLLPHKIIMKIWMKQQKHDKRENVD